LLCFAIIFCSVQILYGQLLDSISLDTTKILTLDQALKTNPLKVYKLTLRKHKLTELPQEIYQFKNLQYLDISKNKIHQFPKEIATFKYLQILNISGNNLDLITREIGFLVYLKELDAGQNHIVEIPPEIKYLKKLKKIDLWGNEISTLPTEITELKDNLKWLDLRVILMSNKEHRRIEGLLPNTKIKFSKSCSCF